MAKRGSNTVGIIGAGLGALSAAIRLAAAGKQVTVHEQAAHVGGKLGTLHVGGFRFDTGPSLFTLPEEVEALLALVPTAKRPAFHYRKLNEICRYWWPDGKTFVAPAQPKAFAQAAAQTFGVPASAIAKRLAHAGANYAATRPVFLERSLHRADTFLGSHALPALAALPRLGLLRTMHAANVRDLKEQHLVQYFDRYATYNGSNPYRCPATLNMIAHLEHTCGAYYPEGGMGQIGAALRQAAQALGVRFQLNTEVTRLVADDGKAKGVRLGEVNQLYDATICNVDFCTAQRSLVPERYRDKASTRTEPSSSALIFYWGVEGVHPQLGLHNILFSSDYKAEFEAMAQGSIADDATVYINISSKMDATDAPTGCENWFVLVNAPYHAGQDWEAVGARVRGNVLGQVQAMLGINLKGKIRSEHILNPKGIEESTGSYKGALYGTSSNTATAAFLRPPNASRTLKRLYYCGGSVHPGGGIPLVLLSGKIAAEAVLRDME